MTADLEVQAAETPVVTEAETEAGSSSAPYMAFAGLKNLLERLQRDGVPQVFDGSFFGKQSGSLTAQTRGTLRYFELIDENKQPTPLLRELVQADEQRRVEILRGLAESRLADAIALGEANGTQGQLDDVFRNRGLTGATVVKAVAFYLGLAEYTGLPTSPFFKKGRVPTGNSGGARRAPRKKSAPTSPALSPPPPNAPTVGTVEAKKAAYIDMLMKLAEGSAEKGEVADGLLDRIERALGYTGSPASSSSEEGSRDMP